MHGLALLVRIDITKIIKNKYFIVDSLSVMLTELTNTSCNFVENKKKKNISPASSCCTFILEINFFLLQEKTEILKQNYLFLFPQCTTEQFKYVGKPLHLLKCVHPCVDIYILKRVCVCCRQIKVLLVQKYLNLTWNEITSTLTSRPEMDALCRKDTKAYAYSMYESVYAS